MQTSSQMRLLGQIGPNYSQMHRMRISSFDWKLAPNFTELSRKIITLFILAIGKKCIIQVEPHIY